MKKSIITAPPVTDIPHADPFAKIMANSADPVKVQLAIMARRWHDEREHDGDSYLDCDNYLCKANAELTKG